MYHILIVDEEEHLLWALERNLFPERNDIAVHTAGTGEEGLQVLEDESIDLLVSDIKMPGDVDGFQLILRAKEKVPDARVMIITAFGTHRIQNFAERIGISHYIEKPFTVDELRNAVLEILDEKEGFQGVLSDLELTDIIQMLCLAKRTALLHLKHRDHRGRIVFDAGDVVHAEFDGTVGAEAVYEMLDLRQGDIFMQSDFEASERTIDIGWQDLLLEGVKRTDEQRMKRERERTRKKRQEADDADDGDSTRTKTPMGMGAPSMADEEIEERTQSTLEESTDGAMLFSEEELQEISQASEAALEESVGESSDEEATTIDDEDLSSEPAFDEHDPSPASSNEADDVESIDENGAQAESADTAIEEPATDHGDMASSPQQMDRESTRHSNVEGMGVLDPADRQSEDAAASVESAQGASVDEPEPVRESGQIYSSGPFAAVNNSADLQTDLSTPDPEAPGGDRAHTMGNHGSSGSSASSPEPLDEEPREAQRQRSGTSPGMAAVTSDTRDEDKERDVDALAEHVDGGADNEPTGVDIAVDDGDEPSQAWKDFVDECPGLKATALVNSEHGRLVRFVQLAGDGVDEDTMASRLVNLVARAQRSVTTLDGSDRLRELQLVLSGEYLIVRTLNDGDLIHAVLADRNVSLGVALVLMRQFATRQTEENQA